MILVGATNLCIGYTFLPYGSAAPPKDEGKFAATAAIIAPLQSLGAIAQLTNIVAERKLDQSESSSHLVICDSDSIASLMSHTDHVLSLDAGPFDSLEEAASLCQRWLHEFWECHKLEGDLGNSCFEFGACHRRCWWRQSIGQVVLRLDTIVESVEQPSAEAIASSSPSLASLFERAAADAVFDTSETSDKSLLVLRGSIVSVGPNMHYAGLRPLDEDSQRSRARPIRMSASLDGAGSRGRRRQGTISNSSSPTRGESVSAAPELVVRPCVEGGKGMGAFAAAAIREGTYVCSYRGELLTRAEVDARYDGNREAQQYLFELEEAASGADGGLYVDGLNSEHPSRFINHAENGNLTPVMGMARGADAGLGDDKDLAAEDMDGAQVVGRLSRRLWDNGDVGGLTSIE